MKKREKIVLAAVLGGTNTGQAPPDREDVQRLMTSERDVTLEGATMALWRGYMESDEIADMFLAEVKWWFRSNLKKVDEAYVKRVWPHVWKVVY